jgi:hypothetical protein
MKKSSAKDFFNSGPQVVKPARYRFMKILRAFFKNRILSLTLLGGGFDGRAGRPGVYCGDESAYD